MAEDLINIYEREVLCEYRNEKYLVRDNGAVLRLKRECKKKRPLDEQWTFGNPDKRKGYMNFSSEVVHRIVATAYKGNAPSRSHVVDHIDTNKQNNRPENLRWVTKLENILLNPVTLRRVINLYGSIDNFLENPSKPIYKQIDSNFEWMRAVSKEEADSCRQRLESWAAKREVPKGGSLGEWLYKPIGGELKNNKNDFIQALTDNALQKKWKTPNEFPHCPKSINVNAIETYKENLKVGKVFSRNQYGESVVVLADINKNTQEIIVLTNSANIKGWALARIYVDDELFIHESLGSFFSLDGGKKQFTLSLGLKWMGEDSIDDYL